MCHVSKVVTSKIKGCRTTLNPKLYDFQLSILETLKNLYVHWSPRMKRRSGSKVASFLERASWVPFGKKRFGRVNIECLGVSINIHVYLD